MANDLMEDTLTSAGDIIRASGIGASEIAAVMGISPFDYPWDIYARKLGIIGRKEQTEAMFWGKKQEPVIAQVFSERTGYPIEWCDKRIWSKKRPWQYASPDAFVIPAPTAPKQILECKTAGLQQAGDWDRDADGEDGVPEYYVAQVEWQMSVCELDLAYIAVLIAGNDFRIYEVPHDPVREEILLEAGENFWSSYLLPKIEPPMGGSDDARKYLRKHFPREREKLRPATVEEIDWLNEYLEVRRLLDAEEARKNELENQITKAIGDNEGLEWRRGKLTWKRTKDRSEVNWEKLANDQLEGFSKQEKAAFIEQYTETVHGHRRIHFHEAKGK